MALWLFVYITFPGLSRLGPGWQTCSSSFPRVLAPCSGQVPGFLGLSTGPAPSSRDLETPHPPKRCSALQRACAQGSEVDSGDSGHRSRVHGTSTNASWAPVMSWPGSHLGPATRGRGLGATPALPEPPFVIGKVARAQPSQEGMN